MLYFSSNSHLLFQTVARHKNTVASAPTCSICVTFTICSMFTRTNCRDSSSICTRSGRISPDALHMAITSTGQIFCTAHTPCSLYIIAHLFVYSKRNFVVAPASALCYNVVKYESRSLIICRYTSISCLRGIRPQCIPYNRPLCPQSPLLLYIFARNAPIHNSTGETKLC